MSGETVGGLRWSTSIRWVSVRVVVDSITAIPAKCSSKPMADVKVAEYGGNMVAPRAFFLCRRRVGRACLGAG